ncbi:LptA/OstA family protein [Amorphus coralli]|uniref:LptA/OstA family protein n=1 Tax=Amorphus coralli TaxID=340680 RepID=UPI00037632C7|nr:LptA/OstA family protein [Amorphus coralli]
MTGTRLRLFLSALLFAAVAAAPASAQTFETGFSGLGGESEDPIQIESDELEVRDQEGIAVFDGNVVVVQGESRMRSAKLIVHYDGGGQATDGAAQPASDEAGEGGQQISRLEIIGNVVVTSKDQTATGDRGDVDMKTNMLELNGNVTLTQGPNIVNGDKLVVNLDTGHARVLSDSRVRVLLVPNSAKQPQ